MKSIYAIAAAGLIALGAHAQESGSEIGYEEGSLGFSAMMEGDWQGAEAALEGSAEELGSDPARLLQLAEVYRQTGRTADADALYREVLGGEDMKLVLADGRVVSAHNIAGARLATEMRASID